jgi:endonuclease/exonuclease/phosphatase family metal-dependent hydrolase
VTLLRLATANLLHGMSLTSGVAGEDDLRGSARLLAADVVGLQEVDRHQERSGLVDQTAVVAELVGASAWRFVPALEGTPDPSRSWRPTEVEDGSTVDGPTYGVGLVSRLPVRSWHVLRLGASRVGAPLLVPGEPRSRLMHVPDEPRVALAAVLEGPNGPFTAVTTHLSFVPGVNVAQLRRVVRWAAAFPGPRLLLGDFNLPGALPRRITRWEQLARAATYPSYRPRIQFDHVLGDGVTRADVRDVKVVRMPVSDHCALRVDVDV